MKKTTAYWFDADALALLNIFEGPRGVEPWGDLAWEILRPENPDDEGCYALDLDGSTKSASGANCLLPADAVGPAIARLTDAGFWCERSETPLVAGHYGDGNWPGVELLWVDRQQRWLLVENE